MGMRRKGRECALQIVYLADVSQLSIEKATASQAAGEEPLDVKSLSFAKKLAAGTWEHKSDLDALIVKYAKNWELSRMAAIDRNILRIGAYELLYEKDTPISVVIDEAVQIAKLYSTPESGKFVNGILDKIKSERNGHAEG